MVRNACSELFEFQLGVELLQGFEKVSCNVSIRVPMRFWA